MCPEQKTFVKLKNFLDSLYDYDYSGVNDEESSDEAEAAIITETDQPNQSVTWKLISQNSSVTLTVVMKKKKLTLRNK